MNANKVDQALVHNLDSERGTAKDKIAVIIRTWNGRPEQLKKEMLRNKV
jgi:hypothetical protein